MELQLWYTNHNQLSLSSQIIGLLRDLMALLSSVTIVQQLTGTGAILLLNKQRILPLYPTIPFPWRIFMLINCNFYQSPQPHEHVAVVTNRLTMSKRSARIPTKLATAAEIVRYLEGSLVQEAFPRLNALEREFLLSGMTEKEQRQFYDCKGDAPMRFEVHDES